MQWGFMATEWNNGDGDERFGMDPGRLAGHNDYGALVSAYRHRAKGLGGPGTRPPASRPGVGYRRK